MGIRMIRLVPIVALALAICWLNGTVEAQSRLQAPRRPTTSPYLNLLRRPGGGGLGFNYYQRVRPEFEFRNDYQRLNRSLQQLQGQTRQQQQLLQGLTTTGHQTSFLNYGSYYPLGSR